MSSENELFEEENVLAVLTGIGPKVSTKLWPPIHIAPEDRMVVALSQVTFYNSFPNIQEMKNNEIEITPGKGKTPIMIRLPTGAYEISEMNTEITHQLTSKGVKNADKNFVLAPNLATLKSMITLREDFSVNFNTSYTMADVLGFSKMNKLIGNRRFESDHIVNINQITSLLVFCNCVRPSYVQGKLKSILSNLILSCEPGVKYFDRPQHLTYLPVLNNVLSEITCWVLDQDLHEVQFRGETLEIELKIKIRRYKGEDRNFKVTR